MFELRAASKRYGQSWALHPTDLRVEPGRTTVLIGPSGCGKSTLIRLMAGLIQPDAGEVRFDGQPLTPDRLPQLRRSIGYVIQEGGLFPHLTGRGNVALMASHLRWPADRIQQRVAELTNLAHLEPRVLDRYPTEMSGGQRQRVALIRALMLDPAVLLLDEPLGALDPMIRFDLQNDLLAIFRRLAKTVVLVTHDLAEAAFLGDALVLLRDGRIVQQGTLTDLTDRPSDPFVDHFIRAQRPPPGLVGGAA